MLKRLSTALFVAILFAGFTFAQSQGVEVQKKKIADDNWVPGKINTSIQYNGSRDDHIEATNETTTYDYFSNSVVRDQITWYDGLPHVANMIMGWDGDPELRMVVYQVSDGTNWVSYPTGTARRGWPQIDVSLTGAAMGTVGIVDHVPCNLNLFDGVGGFITSDFDPDTDPSLQFSGNNIYLATSGNRVEFQFYETMDFGSTFNNWGSIADYTPSPIKWILNGGVEVDMFKSPDEQYIGMLGTNANLGHVVDGIDPDSADNVWLIYSEDAGASWSGMRIAVDGVINSVDGYHTDNYAPLYENFGQVHGAVGNDGVFHVVANGYGLVFDDPNGTTAIANSTPVLYWNSGTDMWKAISSVELDTLSSLVELQIYPGNGLGQFYPQISASDNGQTLFAMWTGPQLTSTGEVDTTNANGFYWLDQYATYSLDGGATWSDVETINNDPSVSETFGHAANRLEDLGGANYRAHIVYMNDLSAGVNVFDEGDATENPIMYMYYDFQGVDVDDEDVATVNSFNLEQNYPNPFNPTTNIKFTLAERSNVNLTVYDMLGREVATLVNSTKDAGSYEVNFDASNLASGLYVYTLKAGNFKSTKKMMLMK